MIHWTLPKCQLNENLFRKSLCLTALFVESPMGPQAGGRHLYSRLLKLRTVNLCTCSLTRGTILAMEGPVISVLNFIFCCCFLLLNISNAISMTDNSCNTSLSPFRCTTNPMPNYHELNFRLWEPIDRTVGIHEFFNMPEREW